MAKDLKRKDLKIEHLKGSGPGGQNRNKRLTGVRITHLPTGLTTRSTERRSQSQNLAAGLDRIEEKVELFFKPKKFRKKTRTPHGSREARIQAKKHRSLKKKERKAWE